MQFDGPRVSVLVPCYNVADYVADAVRCAAEQTYAPHEILCIDDGSTDDTWEVLQALQQEYDGLVKVSTGPNQGAPAARNALLEASTGTFVQFLDADDLLHPNKLERQVPIAMDTGANIVAGAYVRRFLDGATVTQRVEQGDAWVGLLNGRLGITSSNLWRRSALIRCGGWNRAWASSQDYELMFRLLQRGARVAFDDEPLATIRNREASISNPAKMGPRARALRLRANVVEYLRAGGGLTEERCRAVMPRLFLRIRMLAAEDLTAARAYHDRIIPAGFVPSISASNTRAYVWSYRLLGFSGAETLRRALHEWRRPGRTRPPRPAARPARTPKADAEAAPTPLPVPAP